MWCGWWGEGLTAVQGLKDQLPSQHSRWEMSSDWAEQNMKVQKQGNKSDSSNLEIHIPTW